MAPGRSRRRARRHRRPAPVRRRPGPQAPPGPFRRGGLGLVRRPPAGGGRAWCGGRRRVETERVLEVAASSLPTGITLALGEPGRGVTGWRLSHQQAVAALPVALRSRERLVRYADVALLSSALRDSVLVRSLRGIYLAPLEKERDGGFVLLETLSAYFEAGRNASSAAAILGLSRNTVSVRLRAIEQRIGRTIDGCAAELETALRLTSLTGIR